MPSLSPVPPPPIQGLGLSGGVRMQVELMTVRFDYKLQQVTDKLTQYALTQLVNPTRTHVFFRAEVPQVNAISIAF